MSEKHFKAPFRAVTQLSFADITARMKHRHHAVISVIYANLFDLVKAKGPVNGLRYSNFTVSENVTIAIILGRRRSYFRQSGVKTTTGAQIVDSAASVING